MNELKPVPMIVINFPKDGKIRSRKVVKRSNARNSGKYPSWKMQRMMQWESVHEGNAMRILDAHPNVISFNEPTYDYSDNKVVNMGDQNSREKYMPLIQEAQGKVVGPPR